LGRWSETGREERVTPKFGERKKKKKNSTPNSGRYSAFAPSLCFKYFITLNDALGDKSCVMNN
jgi:hypothetical protein